jgi:hypothetical protein
MIRVRDALVVLVIATSPVLAQATRDSSGIAPSAVRRKAPLPDHFMIKQVAAGVGGGLLGAAAGILTGVGVMVTQLEDDDGLETLGYPLVGGALGYILGSVLAIDRYSESRGVHGSFVMTLIGGVVGALGGAIPPHFTVMFTIPTGAAWAHNMSRPAVAPGTP